MEKQMTDTNSAKNTEQLAQHIFCTKDAYKKLTKVSRVAKNPDNFVLIFNDIVQLVKGNNQADFVARAPLLMKKINADLSLRKLYMQLINKLQFAESGLQTAASSNERLTERVSDYFSLKFKRDNNSPSQIYVILTITHPGEHHLNKDINLHITTDSHVDYLSFPLLIDGQSQLLMEENDQYFKLLTDDNSHLYLM